MCGRLVVASPARRLAQAVGACEVEGERPPRYNVSPGQEIPAVLNTARDRLRWLRWGFIPPWARDSSEGNRLFNARIETAAEKAAFRASFAKRRCVVPADGFYEWGPSPSGRRPWFIHLKNGNPLLMAGIWSEWQGLEGEGPLLSCAILTTVPNRLMAELHDRMPVILTEEGAGRWLSEEPLREEEWKSLAVPFSEDQMAFHPVSRRVNYSSSEGPDLIAPEYDPQQLEFL